MLGPHQLTDLGELRALELLTPSQRGPDDNARIVALRERVTRNALDKFLHIVRERMGELALLPPINYRERERLVDDLQVKLDTDYVGSYIDPVRGQKLLIQASGNRVAINAMYRQAQRRADTLTDALDEMELLWAGMGPEQVEWRNRALAEPLLCSMRRMVNEAVRHAKYCENAFWTIQNTCNEIVELVKMYDRAAQLGPPVGPD